MTEKKLNVIIPMAGYGTRLRPHTWSKPKPLVGVAGKTVLDHVLDVIATAADLQSCTLAFIIGYLGDQVRDHMKEHYPDVNTHYYVQQEMRGQSHAIAMAREQMSGPTLVLFSDTIVADDMSFLLDDEQPDEAVIWVKQIEDPRRFGVVQVGEEGFVSDLIEKPDGFEHNLAIVGYYYFARGEDLLAAIDKQLKEDLQTKGEFYIADAIKIMLQSGLKLRPQKVEDWLDAGLLDTVLETNRFLLENGLANQPVPPDSASDIIPPVFIHPTASITASQIGPHASIGPNCRIEHSRISDSVVESSAAIQASKLTASLIGKRAKVSSIQGAIDIGDDTTLQGT